MDLNLKTTKLVSIADVKVPHYFYNRKFVGIQVVDELFGGQGLVPTMAIAIHAAKGAGKTTMLMQVLQAYSQNNPGASCGYFSGEESVEQLAFKATNLGVSNISVSNETDVDTICQMMQDLDVVVIDSLPCLTSTNEAGSRKVMDYSIQKLVEATKRNECISFFIQHQTKNKTEKGSSLIGHICDATIGITKNESGSRTFSVEKNRMGQPTEITLNMTGAGFDYDNPVTVVETVTENKGGERAKKKERDISSIKSAIAEGCNNWNTLIQSVEIEDVGRVKRLIKEMAEAGIITVENAGKGSSIDDHKYKITSDLHLVA
jgi:predicted ATP-dependent serine protease